MRNNIILFFGGDSCERDISIITGIQAYENIDKTKYNVYPIFLYNHKMFYVNDMTISNFYNLKTKHLKIAYIRNGKLYIKNKILGYKSINIHNSLLCTHGGNGENGALCGMLDMENIPYTAPSHMASGVLIDKCITKYMLKALKIPHLDFLTLNKGEYINYVNIAKRFAFPIVVKPAKQGSSIGVGIVNSIESLKEAIELAFYYDNKVLIERGLTNFTEYNIALYRHDGEICLSEIESPIIHNDILGFDDKYMTNGKMNGGCRELPAKIDNELKSEIEKYAVLLYKSLEMKGVVRIDYLYKDGKLYLNEANTIPGSLAFYLFEGKGIKYSKLIDDILDEAVIDKHNADELISYYNSSVLKNVKYAPNKLRK